MFLIKLKIGIYIKTRSLEFRFILDLKIILKYEWLMVDISYKDNNKFSVKYILIKKAYIK